MNEEIEAIKKLRPGEEVKFREVRNPALVKFKEILPEFLGAFHISEMEVGFEEVRLSFKLEESDLVVKRLG